MSVQLPKQWRHWCRSAGLKRYWSRGATARAGHQWFYLKGNGRVWRVNCYTMLQCGDLLEDFDRWALCQIVEAPLPATLAEFRATVAKLLAEAEALPAEEDEDEECPA